MNNRFDNSFNDVDIVTSRPFSHGHPDGVWIASILYGLPLVGCVIGILATIVLFFIKGTFNAAVIIGLVLCGILFFTLISLMFKRSDKSIYIASFFTFLSVCAATFAHGQHQMAFYALVGVSVANLYFVYYLFGLKSDGLLGHSNANITKQNF